jgi:hypothetical protein
VKPWPSKAYFIITAVLIFPVGCSYHRGLPGNTCFGSGENRSNCCIAIAPVKNLSLAPQAEGIFTEQLHRYFTRTPGWQLSEEPQADVLLDTCLEHFVKHCGNKQQGLVQSLRLTLKASASLRSAENNRYHFQNIPFQAEIYYEIAETNDIYYAAIPLLTRDLVEKIGRAVCLPWRSLKSEDNPFTKCMISRSTDTDTEVLTKDGLRQSEEDNLSL